MGPGRPPLRGTKRGLLNLKLGHPPEPLASLPVLPSLSPDFQPPEPFPSISPLPRILACSCHHALCSPSSRSRTPSGSAANPAAARLAAFSLRDRRLSQPSAAHTPNPLRTPGPSHDLRLRAPRAHHTHRAPRAATPHSACRQRRLRASTSAEPGGSLEPAADGKGCGKRRRRGPGGVRRGRAGPGRLGNRGAGPAAWARKT